MQSLLIGPKDLLEIKRVRRLAESRPFPLDELRARIHVPGLISEYAEKLKEQTAVLPLRWAATYTVEDNATGRWRHVSISVDSKLPAPIVAWEIAMEFGFIGSLEQCRVWIEPIIIEGETDGAAINIAQRYVANDAG